ncbi:leucine-rich repeat receptor-like protein kinase TDR [Telopea speciosissima]|uniref:leucine-rich repeat receptor-like protein kinase TDR n=1 Tax=Telopea speciosissima TaxID=54955 RepID=UPI001CC56589|nr:leucine-rich repeat receptor-like protein kinase TDR [Telopea speciosissima]
MPLMELFQPNSFTGQLPQEIVRLRFLQVLNLGGSFFQGSIPARYGGLSRLKFLHLSGNYLQGPIPPELCFLTQLEYLEIGYNVFSGGVPVEFGLLSNLRYLDISTSNLSGYLPSELGNLTLLKSLFLFGNRFIGEIPEVRSSFLLSYERNRITVSNNKPERIIIRLTLGRRSTGMGGHDVKKRPTSTVNTGVVVAADMVGFGFPVEGRSPPLKAKSTYCNLQIHATYLSWNLKEYYIFRDMKGPF